MSESYTTTSGSAVASLYGEYINDHRIAHYAKLGCDREWVHAEGQYLYDRAGNKYLDLCAGYSLFALGRNHPAIKSALIRAIDGNGANLVHPMGYSGLAADLAKALVQLAPKSIKRVAFVNSGSEATEAAIKFARKATRRDRFVFCDGAFHGLTTGSLALNGDSPLLRKDFGPLIPATRIPFNDGAALESVLETEDVAGFIFEPIQGRKMQVAETQWLRQAAEMCSRTGTLLIADEVQTGLGRTGKMFACEHSGLEPDIITVSKTLSGGFVPVGAVLYSEAIYGQVFPASEWFVHSSTFRENDLAMAAGLATLRELQKADLVARAEQLSNHLVSRVETLRRKHPVLGPVSGRGLMLGIEIHLEPDVVIQEVTSALLRDERILVQVAPWLKLTPPLVISDVDVDWIVESLDRVLSRVPR